MPSPIVSLVYQVVTMETNEELEGRFQEKDESQRKRFQEKKNKFAFRSIICNIKGNLLKHLLRPSFLAIATTVEVLVCGANGAI